MKIKKIAAQCKEKGRAEIIDVIDSDGVLRQWISTGYALYPVDGMPYLEVEHLPTIFELSEKKQDEMILRASERPGEIDFRDAVERESIAKPEAVHIIYSGRELLPLTSGGVTYFVDKGLLTPIESEYEDVELWLRRSENNVTYFAAKSGLMLVGIILPMNRMQGMVGSLRDIADCLRTIAVSYQDIPAYEAQKEEQEIEGQEEL